MTPEEIEESRAYFAEVTATARARVMSLIPPLARPAADHELNEFARACREEGEFAARVAPSIEGV